MREEFVMRDRHTLKIVGLTIALALTACKSPKKESGSNQAATGAGDSSVVLDYPKLYCEHVSRLKLRTDVSNELGVFCENGLPTQQMLDFRSRAIAAEPGKIELVTLKSEQDDATDTSRFMIAWSFRVPIRPFEVKSRPIYEFIAKGYQSEAIKLVASSKKRDDDPLDSGLHLWSVDMNYTLNVKGTSGISLDSQRKTQYNLYQVQSGNEEMGFGVEHLADAANPDFTRSTMINLSFNDGEGYNDGKGGAVVITTLHFEINNQGFPSTARQAILEIAQFIANEMYQGLKQ
jgi:hypothetical protein